MNFQTLHGIAKTAMEHPEFSVVSIGADRRPGLVALPGRDLMLLLNVAEAAKALREAQKNGEDEIIGHSPEGSSTWFETLEFMLDATLDAALKGKST